MTVLDSFEYAGPCRCRAELERLRTENAELRDIITDAVDAHTPDAVRKRAWAALAASTAERREGE